MPKDVKGHTHWVAHSCVKLMRFMIPNPYYISCIRECEAQKLASLCNTVAPLWSPGEHADRETVQALENS